VSFYRYQKIIVVEVKPIFYQGSRYQKIVHGYWPVASISIQVAAHRFFI